MEVWENSQFQHDVGMSVYVFILNTGTQNIFTLFSQEF